MNIREIAQFTGNYFEINREERNYAAILYTALCLPGNSERFLKYCGIDPKAGRDLGIYFEYSLLRDLWNSINRRNGCTEEDANNTKKNMIRSHLGIEAIDDILGLPLREMNEKFGVVGEASSQYVQYPGKWAIAKYQVNFPDNKDFLKICRFKWAFNIKPDIVIHVDKNTALCIEAKYESRQGCYPTSDSEKSIFLRRGISSKEYVGQLELQEYMMRELLGLETEFRLIALKVPPREKCGLHKPMNWAEAFGCLDISEMPPFANRMVKIISEQSK